jgi:hypothetical protein
LTAARQNGYIFLVLLAEGRRPEAFGGGAGCGARGRASQARTREAPGPRSTGTMTGLRGARCTIPGANAGDGNAAPGTEKPRWSAGRRARYAKRAPRPKRRQVAQTAYTCLRGAELVRRPALHLPSPQGGGCPGPAARRRGTNRHRSHGGRSLDRVRECRYPREARQADRDCNCLRHARWIAPHLSSRSPCHVAESPPRRHRPQ